jgi:hypothetical protein
MVNSDLKVGDRVTFVTRRETARCISLSAKKGLIEKIEGHAVTIKSRGRIYTVHAKTVRLQDQPNALTEALAEVAHD